MSKTKQRRIKNSSRRLKKLASDGQLEIVWRKKLVSWLREIQRRSLALRSDEPSSVKPIFEVLENAERLLKAAGAEVEAVVGPATRGILTAEACQAVARVYGPEMFRLVQHRSYDQMRDWQRHTRALVARVKET